MKISDRELATILAALRHWQKDVSEKDREGLDWFAEHTPLTDDEIDSLCETLAA